MHATHGNLQTTARERRVSRRVAVRGLGGVGIAMLVAATPGLTRANGGDQIQNALFAPSSSDDPAAVLAIAAGGIGLYLVRRRQTETPAPLTAEERARLDALLSPQSPDRP